jgi:hypothetical protein
MPFPLEFVGEWQIGCQVRGCVANWREWAQQAGRLSRRAAMLILLVF